MKHLSNALFFVSAFLLMLSPTLFAQDDSLPQLSPITAANAAQVEELNRYGKGWVDALVWSPDGETLALGGALGVWLHDVNALDGEPETLSGDPQAIESLAFSLDGRLLAGGSAADSVWLWDRMTGEVRHVLLVGDDGAKVEALWFSPDSHHLVSLHRIYGANIVVRLWDTQTGALLRTTEGRLRAAAVTFSEGKIRLATANEQGNLSVWDMESGERLATLQDDDPSSAPMYALAFSPDGRVLASATRDTIRIWDVKTGTERAHFSHTDDPHFARQGEFFGFSPDSSILVLASGSVYDAEAGLQLIEAHGPPYGRFLFNETGSVFVYDGEVQDTTSGETRPIHRGAYDAALNPSGSILAGLDDGAVRLWDVASGEEIISFPEYGERYEDYPQNLMFVPDTYTLMFIEGYATVKQWMIGAEAQTIPFEERLPGLSSAALSPDGQLLGLGQSDGGLQVFNTSAWEQVGSMQAYDGWQVHSLVFSPDGTLLATGGGSDIMDEPTETNAQLWDIATGTRRALLLHQEKVNDLVFSPDGRLLITASGNTQEYHIGEDNAVRIWDVASGEQLAIMRHEYQVFSVAISPDGNFIAAGSWGPVTIWNVRRALQVGDLDGSEADVILTEHNHWIESLAFSPEGDLLASASWDGTFRLWDTTTWSSLAVLGAGTWAGSSMVFSHDGTLLASAGGDGTIRLWGVPG